MSSQDAERILRVLEWLGQTHQGFWTKGMRADFEFAARALERRIVRNENSS
jgi:hypothetical protein